MVERREIGCSGVSGVMSAASDCLLAGVVVNVGDAEVGEDGVCERVAGRLLGVEGALGRDIVVSLDDEHSKNTVCQLMPMYYKCDTELTNVRRV